MTQLPGESTAADQPGPGLTDLPGDQGWYLYGITRSGGLTSEELNRSLAGSGQALSQDPLEVVDAGPLAAIVQPVSLNELSMEAIQARSEDRAWLEGIVRAHNSVIALIHENRAVSPARFGSIYASVREVREALSRAADDVLAQLDRLDDTDEWAVHVYADPARIPTGEDASSRIRQLEEELAQATPGRAYFLRRQLDEDRAGASGRALQALAQRAFDALGRISVEAHAGIGTGAPQRPSGDVEVLRAALLVRRSEIPALRQELARLDALDGVQTELTGPWPPYSFVSLPGTEP
jgi:hypothetical protein